MANLLSLVEKHPAIWRGSDAAYSRVKRVPTGFADLDQALLGGFPQAGVVRVTAVPGCGELSFLRQVFSIFPAEALFLFINPPGNLSASALAERSLKPSQCRKVNTTPELALWAAEQSIKSASCGMVMLWCQSVSAKSARRLQVAASQHDCLMLLFEMPCKHRIPLPIPLDISLNASTSGLHINIHKLQGGWPRQNIAVDFIHTPNNNAISLAMKKYVRQPMDGALHG